MSHSRIFGALLLALPFLFGHPLGAHAQGGSLSPKAAEARAHYETGLSAYALEHFAEAATEYEKAFELKSDPALLYNAAQAHRLAGNYDRALHLYQSYLRIFGKKASNRAEVERHIAELESTVAAQKRAQQSPPIGVAEPESAAVGATVPPSPPSAAAPEAGPAPEINLLVAAPPPPKPLYKKGWFWGTVVAAVVVVGVGVGLGVGLSGTRDPVGSLHPVGVQ